MDIAELPFNRHIGLESGGTGSAALVALAEDDRYTNHLGTVHASALLAVAEAGSGEFLARSLGELEGFVPVVRRLEAKFRRPASGRVTATCDLGESEVGRWREKLERSGKALVCVPVEVVDASGAVVMSAQVEWFISRHSRIRR